jgi:hypothetical protein
VDLVRAFVARIVGAWRAMAFEQRLATIASLLLLATLFLPWYQKSYFDTGRRLPAQDSLNGFDSADFVLASVVLVAVAVLGMMFARAEGRGFHLPGGDGLIVMIAGGWCALLIFYRVLDHPDPSDNGTTIGIQWGVFVAFLAAAFLVYAGLRIRTAHRPEPPLPAAEGGVVGGGRGGGGGSTAPTRPAGGARPARPARRPSAARDEAWTAVEPLRVPEPGRDAEPGTDVAVPPPAKPPAVPPRARPAARPGEEPTEIAPRRRRPRTPPDDLSPPDQLSFDESETKRLPER